jgi:SAM-dependent methyltransferase
MTGSRRPHAMLPDLSVGDRSRQVAVVALRRFLNTNLRSNNLQRFEDEAVPAFEAANGRKPQSHDEVEAAFAMSPSWRLWSGLNRAAQEMLWIATGEPVFRADAQLQAAYARFAGDPAKRGSLHLDPALDGLGKVAAVDIHLQPGGYTLDRGPNDVTAGALYEMGGRVFSSGQGIGKEDSKAGCVIRFLRERDPGFAPRRILDIGCSAGGASCDYAREFPAAEVHAVDVGAGMLRYAHARAEALGVAVSFHQMSATDLRFPDGHFDLIVSHNAMHEIDDPVRVAMLRESFRLLAAGGITVHQDVPYRFRELSVPAQVEKSWDVRFNNEPFWVKYATADVKGELIDAGFAAAAVEEQLLPKLHGPGTWYAALARKS